MLQDFKSSNSYEAVLLVSIFELGEVLGPTFIAPLSELYGRLIVWHSTCILFVACSVINAASNSLNMIIAFRFFSGCFNPTVISSAITSDLCRQEDKGRGMTIAGFAPLIGPTFGPTIGGYLTQNAGWRWTFWFVAIVAATVELMLAIFLRETSPIKLLKDKARMLRKETNRADLKSKYESNASARELFVKAALRPLRFLLFSPIVTLMSLYSGLVYGYLYLVLTTLTGVLEDIYGFSASSAGLSFVAMGM
jgi:MFS family permease